MNPSRFLLDDIADRRKSIDYLLNRKETFASFYIRDDFIVSNRTYAKKYKEVLSSRLVDAFELGKTGSNILFNSISIIVILFSSSFFSWLTISIKVLGFNPNFFVLIGIYFAILSFIIPASNNIWKNYLFNKLNLYRYCELMNDELFKENTYKNQEFENAIYDLIYMNSRMRINEYDNFVSSKNEIICRKTYKYYKKIEKDMHRRRIDIKKEYDKNCKKITPNQSITLSIIMLIASCCVQAIAIWKTWNDIQQSRLQFLLCIISFLVLAFILTSLFTRIYVESSMGKLESLICIQSRMKLEMPYSIDDKTLVDNKIIIKGFNGRKEEFEYFKTKITKKIIEENKLNITSRDIYNSNGDIVIICTNLDCCDNSELLKLFCSNSYEELIKKLNIDI
ncbi:MAG: hypothetical protein MJ213_01350 [Bacilli bacterium]|nr:hypothetical protein [Bacilli bacterium]